MRNKWIKSAAALFVTAVTAAAAAVHTYAYEPYTNYTFTPDRQRVIEPQAVLPDRIITGADIGIGEFNGLTDIYIRNDKCYLSDTGNNRILITDLNFHLLHEVVSFQNNGQTDTFQSPQGLFVDENENIYICDTANNRIVVLNSALDLVQIVGKPESEVFEEEYVFLPKSVSVDNAGRIFIVAENVNQGIIELDKNGAFQNFFGPIQVQPNAWQAFLKLFATEEQKAQMTITVPTEYSNIDIDARGFVFGTVSVFEKNNFNETIFIHKLNPIGNDILDRNGYAAPMGNADYEIDEKTGEYKVSRLIDIKAYENQFYSVLDEENGCVFTYNNDGFLLYVFGAKGDHLGQFTDPAALEVSGDRYYVVDRGMNCIVEFSLTDYGYNIKQAVLAEGELEYEKADEYWGKVMLHTAKSYFTYNRIGTSALKNGDYENALKYLKIAENKENYSLSFGYLRDRFFSDHFTIIAIVVILSAGGVIAIKILRNRRKKQ